MVSASNFTIGHIFVQQITPTNWNPGSKSALNFMIVLGKIKKR